MKLNIIAVLLLSAFSLQLQAMQCNPSGKEVICDNKRLERNGNQKIKSIAFHLVSAPNLLNVNSTLEKTVTLTNLPESMAYLRNYDSNSEYWQNPLFQKLLKQKGIDLKDYKAIHIDSFEPASPLILKNVEVESRESLAGKAGKALQPKNEGSSAYGGAGPAPVDPNNPWPVAYPGERRQ
jgi:hypothetical protein